MSIMSTRLSYLSHFTQETINHSWLESVAGHAEEGMERVIRTGNGGVRVRKDWKLLEIGVDSPIG